MTTERCSPPLDFAGLSPAAAEDRLCVALERLAFRQRRVQPDLSREAILTAVDEYLVDYATAGFKRTQKIEDAAVWARNAA